MIMNGKIEKSIESAHLYVSAIKLLEVDTAMGLVLLVSDTRSCSTSPPPHSSLILGGKSFGTNHAHHTPDEKKSQG
jgi:hypothetical protein